MVIAPTDTLVSVFSLCYHNTSEKSGAISASQLTQRMGKWVCFMYHMQKNKTAVQSQYMIAGVEAIQRKWVERGFQESLDEVVAMAEHAIQKQLVPRRTSCP